LSRSKLANVKMTVFLVVTPWSLLQGQNLRSKLAASIFMEGDRRSTFVRNVSTYLPNCTASYTGRP